MDGHGRFCPQDASIPGKRLLFSSNLELTRNQNIDKTFTCHSLLLWGNHRKPYPPIEQPCTDQEGTGGNLQNLAMNHVDVFLFSYYPAFPPENSGFWHVQLPKKTGGSHDRFGQEQMEEMKERLDELKEMKDMMRLAKNHWCPVMINLSDYTPVNLVN